LNGTATTNVYSVSRHTGAAGKLRGGDHIVAVDGRRVTGNTLAKSLQGLHCAGALRNGCTSTRAVTLTVERAGRTLTIPVVPHYDASVKRMLIGITLNVRVRPRHYGLFGAIGTSTAALWDVAENTVT